MSKRALIACLLFPLLLAACNEDSVSPSTYVPELDSFDMIDSYDQDTARPHGNLALNPYLYDGLFDVFWSAYSRESYSVNFRINNRPSIANSLLVHSEPCDPNRRCNQAGNFICTYTSDFYLACGTSDWVDIQPLFSQVPQTLYLFMEVCDGDSSYCEYNYYPVSFE